MDKARIWIKICGITSLTVARAAVEAGVDALGFVFAPSPRRVEPEQARDIIQDLPAGIRRVGVFVDTPPAEMAKVAEYCGLDTIQLHGQEPPDQCRVGDLQVIKAFRVAGPGLSQEVIPYLPVVDALLLDTHHPASAGGTGVTFDWSLARELRDIDRPLILAGGLTAANVQDAIRCVQPFGVDISSGVEIAGRKNPELIRRFVKAARTVQQITAP